MGIFVGEFFFRLALAKEKQAHLIINKADGIVIGVFFILILFIKKLFTLLGLAQFLGAIGITSTADYYIVISQLYILVALLLKVPQLNKALLILKLNPSLVVIVTFLTIIGIGTMLLLLPRSTASGKETIFLDALFTATSATCVTGLIVVDTGTHFSLLGQLIILSLVQIGGLGLMTFTSFFALVLGKGFGLKDRGLLQDILNYRRLGRIGSLLLSILTTTLIIEAAGALLLYSQFLPRYGAGVSSAYFALFHSISAFCNAGFSLFSDSFMSYRANLPVNLIMSSLIVLGGLGFMVTTNLLRWVYSPLKGKKESLSLQSKLVLLVSGLLIVTGMSLILLGEATESLPFKEKLLGAYFQSITARTAGFNTLNISGLSISSAFLLIILMFIGASPGSTGGGVKTSTFATLVFTIKSMSEGKNRVEVFRRTIPRLIVYQALCVVILALGWIAISTFILTLTENAPFINIIFEDLSAFGTVGLSRGLTPNLTPVGRVIIILTMLVGRIGPLTLALAVARRRISELYEYPEERIMIG
ncbi:MAG: TrkH family potassium uptake protein [bacterium]